MTFSVYYQDVEKVWRFIYICKHLKLASRDAIWAQLWVNIQNLADEGVLSHDKASAR